MRYLPIDPDGVKDSFADSRTEHDTSVIWGAETREMIPLASDYTHDDASGCAAEFYTDAACTESYD